jgi:hypothetical protein
MSALQNFGEISTLRYWALSNMVDELASMKSDEKDMRGSTLRDPLAILILKGCTSPAPQ